MSEQEWKDIALYLASCHAATAEYDGHLKGTSKSRRNRYRDICTTALRAISSGTLVDARPQSEQDVVRRLQDAITALTA